MQQNSYYLPVATLDGGGGRSRPPARGAASLPSAGQCYSASISRVAAVAGASRTSAAPAARWPLVFACSISPARARVALRAFATRRAGGGDFFASWRSLLRAAAAACATRFKRRLPARLVAGIGSTPLVM